MKLTIREFTRNIYSYIKNPGVYIITVKGSKKFTIIIKSYEEEDRGKDE